MGYADLAHAQHELPPEPEFDTPAHQWSPDFDDDDVQFDVGVDVDPSTSPPADAPAPESNASTSEAKTEKPSVSDKPSRAQLGGTPKRPARGDSASGCVQGLPCDELLERSRKPKRPPREWYGAALIPTYAIAGTVAGFGVHREFSAPVVVAALAAPTVHWAYGQTGKGFLALAGETLSTGTWGAVVKRDPWVGAAVGYIAWATLDIVVLARRPAPPRKKGATSHVAPQLLVTRNGLYGGVGGTW